MGATTHSFLDHRARRFLGDFRCQVERAMDSIEDSTIPKQEIDDNVASLRSGIVKELARIGPRSAVDSEIASYKPALIKANMYLENYTTAESAEEAFDALYNANFSIGYYLSESSER